MEVISALRNVYGGLDEVTQTQTLVQCPRLERAIATTQVLFWGELW